MKGTLLGFAILSLLPCAALAAAPNGVPESVRVLTAFSTPLKSGHAISFLHGEKLRFADDQAYSKWGVLFEKSLAVKEIEIKSCDGKNFEDGVELFIDHQRARLFADGGRSVVRFKWAGKANALTLHFLESRGVCIQDLKIKADTDWIAPRILAVESVGAATLGDGRLTVGDLLPLAKVATLKWEKPLIVEGLRLWNGDQTAGGGFTSSARVRELEIKTGAVGSTFTLEDLRSEQSLSLPQSGLTTTLALVARSAYPGVVQKTPVLAELQLLAGGEAWIPFDQKASTKADQDRMAPVIERGWIDIFDRELVKDDADNSSEIWRFRFRSDGTFFARIFADRARLARSWSVLGRWELVAESPAGASGARGKRALVMRLNGSRFVGAENWDSLPCGATCFKESDSRGPASRVVNPNEMPISEIVEIQRGAKAQLYIRSRDRDEKPGLDFSDLKVRIQSLYH
ncbi:MAG: hypothetical protein JNJ49_06600 [Bdellovibrionaceae bacterium]|nr:hypothetical protein [Pseudobdellovibrionaceae bacterium]